MFPSLFPFTVVGLLQFEFRGSERRTDSDRWLPGL